MKINESQLRNIIKESVKKVLKEGQQRTPIFTLNAVDLTTDDGIDDMQYTSQTYYSEEEAIEAAKDMASAYSDWDNVINISVMAGEYELPSGDVYGEPYDIYTLSNKDEETTRSAREKSGYTRHDVDGYPNLNESKLKKIIKESVKKVLKEVRYGGEEFHGNKPEDWKALTHLRLGNGDYNKLKKTRKSYQDLFDKEFGHYRQGNSDTYKFPNDDEYDKAHDWISKTSDLGFEKSERVRDNIRTMKKEEGMNVLKQILSNHETFYTKIYQSNGYYPIEEYKYDEAQGGYIRRWGARTYPSVLSINDIMECLTHKEFIFSLKPFSYTNKYEEKDVPFYFI